jgi:hypothetical protein
VVDERSAEESRRNRQPCFLRLLRALRARRATLLCRLREATGALPSISGAGAFFGWVRLTGYEKAGFGGVCDRVTGIGLGAAGFGGGLGNR